MLVDYLKAGILSTAIVIFSFEEMAFASGASQSTLKPEEQFRTAVTSRELGELAHVREIRIQAEPGTFYALKTQWGHSVHTGKHHPNQTVLFKNRQLPAITTEEAKAAAFDVHLIGSTAPLPDRKGATE
ncbi:hypothetical protein A3843_05080 [Pseudovibrio exalbescens]|uniref:Uncharacterized protein n=2 Tax=Pseudovibrio exalbescens TaxID=197461 RepID=A0A1U7JKA3_9HYPH|nr:hypothetical protein A3843_05080 [Pseudovibrio exalbescens]